MCLFNFMVVAITLTIVGIQAKERCKKPTFECRSGSCQYFKDCFTVKDCGDDAECDRPQVCYESECRGYDEVYGYNKAVQVAEKLAASPIPCDGIAKCPKPFRCYGNETCGGCNTDQDCPSNKLRCYRNLCRSYRKLLSCRGKPGLLKEATNAVKEAEETKLEEQPGCDKAHCEPDYVCMRRGALVCVPYLESHVNRYYVNINFAIADVAEALAVDPKACNRTSQCPRNYNCFQGFCGGCEDKNDCPTNHLKCIDNICRLFIPRKFSTADPICKACISDKDCDRPDVCENSICREYANTGDYKERYNAVQVAEELADKPIACHDTSECPKPFRCYENETCGGCNTDRDCPTLQLACLDNICRSSRSFYSESGRKEGTLEKAIINLNQSFDMYTSLPEHKGCENAFCPIDYVCKNGNDPTCIEDVYSDTITSTIREINRAVADVGYALYVDPKACTKSDQCPENFVCFDGFCGGCQLRSDCPSHYLNCIGNICQKYNNTTPRSNLPREVLDLVDSLLQVSPHDRELVLRTDPFIKSILEEYGIESLTNIF